MQSTGADSFPWGNSVGFVVFFVVLWILISGLLGVASGWPILAKQFRATARPLGLTLRGQVWRIGSVPERNVTGLVVAQEGLYLWTFWPFSLRRPPLLIPWVAVRAVRERRVLWAKSYAVDIGAGPEIVVTRRAYEVIHPFLTEPAKHA
jgi:hypothetical protein